MPELPEVETVINYLKNEILDLKIFDINIKNDKFIKNSSKDEFKEFLKNKTIKNISRKGKYLIFELSENSYMISHLRMEGKYFVDDKLINRKHDYLIFKLSNNKYLSYNDSRQFGTFHISHNPYELKEIKKLALDPLEDKFDVEYLYQKSNKSNKNIKTFLLDQSIISGIGNIYASEILFDAKINPFIAANQISKKDIEEIVNSSKKILKLAIKHNGTTIHTFSFGPNKTGDFNNFLKVVYRERKDCFDCHNPIKRIKQQSRSTFYCENCQINKNKKET